jgi:CarD family transcriptional regulator
MKASGTQARSQGVAKGASASVDRASPKQPPAARAQAATVAPAASRSAKPGKAATSPPAKGKASPKAAAPQTTSVQAAAARAGAAMAAAAAKAVAAKKVAAKEGTAPTRAKAVPPPAKQETPTKAAPAAQAAAPPPRPAPRAKAPSHSSIETKHIVTATAPDLRKPAAKAAPDKAPTEKAAIETTLPETALPEALAAETPVAEQPAAASPAPEKPAEPTPAPRAPMPAMINGRPAPVSRAAAKEEFFVEGDYVVYPTHGVGKVEKIAKEEIAGHHLELIHITFEENRMTLRVPVAKARTAGLRKLATRKMFDEALAVLKGRARIKRTMWSRRAQEYEAKINSGDPTAIAEVVRDLHRNAGQPDQSFSERQIYEAAMDRLAAELAALDQTDKTTALIKLGNFLKTL